MPDELPVHINREELHSLEVPATFEADGSFDIRLVNHGESLHVHLHLDDPLSEVAVIEAVNHYVEGSSQRFVRVDVDTDRLDGDRTGGKLKVASGYGATTRWVDVELSEPHPEEDSMDIDESLAKPQPKEPESSVLDSPEIPVLVLGAIALFVAALTVFFIESTVILVGSIVVLAGVLAALAFLIVDR
ncbi:MAG: hypothetical protein V5A55_10930 [Halovenus sp.]